MVLEFPNLGLEEDLLRSHRVICGMDEVGRGAVAGPVYVGACALGASSMTVPVGLRDSKLLSPRRRENLLPLLENWALGLEYGVATAAEIDEFGLSAALRLAGLRALGKLAQKQVFPTAVILDGSFDWLGTSDLFDSLIPHQDLEAVSLNFDVITRVKADLQCASVAAASVVAKVRRDAFMQQLPDSRYDWVSNKGYASKKHLLALQEFGLSEYHRKSWKLPGVHSEGK